MKLMKWMIFSVFWSVLPITANHPKILTSQKLSCSVGVFGLKSFHGFVILNGTSEPVTYLLFWSILKMWEVLASKIFAKSLMKMSMEIKTISSKDTQKSLKMLQQEHIERVKYYDVDF